MVRSVSDNERRREKISSSFSSSLRLKIVRLGTHVSNHWFV